MKSIQIYYILWTHERVEEEIIDEYPERTSYFEAKIAMMTTDYKKAENYLKEIIRSVRRQHEYEERVSSEKYYNNHYEISYYDGETEKYEIRQSNVDMPEQDKELA